MFIYLAATQVLLILLWAVGALSWPWWLVFLISPVALIVVYVLSIIAAFYLIKYDGP